MASIQEGQGLQQNPPAVDGSESIDSKISRSGLSQVARG